MSSPPRVQGRPITTAGLRVILVTMAVFVLLAGVVSFFAKDSLVSIDPELGEVLFPAVLMLAGAEALGYFFLRLRLRKAWRLELAQLPYTSGGALPMSYAQLTLIGAALAEGVGLFAAITHALSGNPYAIGLVGLAFFAILAQLPREEHLSSSRGNP